MHIIISKITDFMTKLKFYFYSFVFINYGLINFARFFISSPLARFKIKSLPIVSTILLNLSIPQVFTASTILIKFGISRI
jgi:hypothetical protein